MFETIIREAASKFGLGDKAGPLVQMLLAYITNKDTGGLAGFVSKLSDAGLGNVAQSWLGGGAGALPINASQIESLLGGQGGLLNSLTSKLGIGGSTVSSALGFLLPAVIGKLTPGGTIPTSLSSEILGFITGGASALTKGVTGATGAAVGAAGAATVAASKVIGSPSHAVGGAANAGVNAAATAGGGLMKWLPWLAVGAIGLFALNYCSKSGVDAGKQAVEEGKSATTATATATADATKSAATATVDAAKTTADSAKSAADAAAKAVAEAIPAGAGAIASMFEGAPSLKVYFDTGKIEIASEFATKSKDIVDYLKANASAKAVVSGFNDPTGNAAANAELSKKRAQAVAAGLKAAGIADDRVILEKPANTTAGAALSNAEARRVEVTIRK